MLVYSKNAWLRRTNRSALEKVRWAADVWRYRREPAAYAREALGVTWWAKQIGVAEALVRHKQVFVKASHAVGKSFLAGGLVNWFFDCFEPGICITTAPNAPQVRDILWKEVRLQRPARGRKSLQPKAPRMESAPDHFAAGLTSRDGSGFQGRHEENVFIVFDECVGVASEFWDAAEGMMTGANCYWLAICNPTDTGSRAYQECQNTEKWHVIEISALDHPNIAAELAGKPAPFPKAVRLQWVEGRIREWCVEVGNRQSAIGNRAGENRTDGSSGAIAECRLPIAQCFEFPPGGGRWWRAGALFESRVMGRWPSQGTDAVWSDAVWERALVRQPEDVGLPVVIGCDVARFGDDFTSIVVRRGDCVLHHETVNGMSTAWTAARLRELARGEMSPRKTRKDTKGGEVGQGQGTGLMGGMGPIGGGEDEEERLYREFIREENARVERLAGLTPRPPSRDGKGEEDGMRPVSGLPPK